MPTERRKPTIIIYGLADARAAAAAAAALDLPVTLRIRADVAAGLGADVIANLFALTRAEFPGSRITAAVNCADAPGLAIALLRRGIDRVRVDGPDEMRKPLADLAAQCSAGLDEQEGEALDLLAVDDPEGACEVLLKGFKTGVLKPNCQ